MSRLAWARSRSWSVTADFSAFRIASRRLQVDSSIANEALAWAISETISGISSRAINSPALTRSPRSLVMDFRYPVTLAYRVTSESARTLAGRTTFLAISCRAGFTVLTRTAVRVSTEEPEAEPTDRSQPTTETSRAAAMGAAMPAFDLRPFGSAEAREFIDLSSYESVSGSRSS